MKKEILVKWPGKTIVSIEKDSITISRKGVLNFLNHGLKGSKTIPFRSITAVQLKKPGATNGYIQFSILGGNENRRGGFEAAKDENTIMFTSKYWKQMKELKIFIEQQQRQQLNPNSQNTDTSIADEISKFKELLDSDIITQEEFDIKKKELLSL